MTQIKKKCFSVITALVMAVCAFAQDFPAYLKMEGTVITGCNRSALPANLVIPEGVTEIGRKAFASCKSLATVSIPTSMTKIHWEAFDYCDNIKTVQYKGTLAQWCEMDNGHDLVANAKTITMPGIVNLKVMTALTIPEGVTKIGWRAFANCKSLANVTIPASVTEIGSGAFYSCDNIKTVQYKGTLAQWCQIDNDEDLVANAKTITMSDVTDLKTMTALVISEGVTKIGYSAFADCKSLTTVSIPASVTKIGGVAFNDCDNIKTVQYKGTLAQWCQLDNYVELVANAKTITMSDLVDLKAMTALTIPEGVTKIGWGAFAGCKSLATISIPTSVMVIGGCAFNGCASLASVSIPASVTEIGLGAFADCKSLASVSIPASVTEISSSVFYGCDNIKTVQYRGTLAQWCQLDNDDDLVKNAKTITMSDIVDLKAMTALTIPEGVTKIGDYAFYGCKSLASVSIPSSVTVIGKLAFKGCDNIKTVQYRGTLARWCQLDNDDELVKNAKTITMSDVADLKTMIALVIPEGVTKIGNNAFDGCKSLVTVSIPASVKSIGSGAFCHNIKTVQYKGTLAQWCEMDNDFSIQFVNTITMSDMADLKAMTTLTIPAGVTRIGGYAFDGCKSLATISIPTSVKSIGEGAFWGCTSLAGVTIPEGVMEIGWDAFWGCKSLASVTIPASVTEIGGSAFYGCKSLASVTIPTSVMKIGIIAFYGCTRLKEVKYLGTKAQWHNITKDSDWHEDVSAKKVICKDGKADFD